MRVLFGHWYTEEAGDTDRISIKHHLTPSPVHRTAFAFPYSLPNELVHG